MDRHGRVRARRQRSPPGWARSDDNDRVARRGGRLVRYVVSKQTDEGAWFYAEPPSASHITHDNYHTGFILDAILVYGLA